MRPATPLLREINGPEPQRNPQDDPVSPQHGPGGPAVDVRPWTLGLLIACAAVALLRAAILVRGLDILPILALKPALLQADPTHVVLFLIQGSVAMLAHWDMTHLLANGLALLLFASVIERTHGGAMMLGAFWLTGTAGNIVYSLAHAGSLDMLVGASGGISGLMALSLVVYVSQRRGGSRTGGTTLVKMALFGGLYMVAVPGLLALTMDEKVTIAWEAHLGGFLMGLALAPLLERRTSRAQ